jgi:hypothetical protein
MLQHNHEYSTIEKTMVILKVTNKGKLLDVLERFYIYKAGKQKSILNEQCITEQNVSY